MNKTACKNAGRTGILAGLTLAWMTVAAGAQTAPPPAQADRPAVHLVAPDCDPGVLQADIGFVTWLAAPGEEDVLVSIRKRLEEGGRAEYTLSFEGRRSFEGEDQTLTAAAPPSATAEEVRAALVRALRLGLLRYAGKTAVVDRLSISFRDKVKPTAVEDKWDFWVFNANFNTFLNGEQSYKSTMLNANASASRVTPGWKLHFRLSGYLNRNSYLYEGEEIESSSNSQNFTAMAVKSLNDHFSVGAYVEAFASSYNNVRFGLIPSPAVEYDLFPYSECTKRQLRFLYRLNFRYAGYLEETIYDKTAETLWGQSLSVTLELKEKWGTISTSLEGSHYFHDFSKNRLELWSSVAIRLFKGLSVNLEGGGSRIRDQLSLPRGGATLEEVLLRRRQLETGYNYFLSVGFSYTFGSTESRVVNPRFGAGPQHVSIRM